MICPGGQILLSKRLPGTGQRLSASPATTIRLSYAMYSNDRDTGGQILLFRRLPGTGQCLSASPATSLLILRTVITVMSVIASAQ